MPTYEYRREDGTIFECRQGINEDALSTCPDTGQKVKRLISGGGGVVYKGDGWYVTDYKDKNSTSSNDSAVNGSSENPSGKPDKSENKGTASEKKESGPVNKTPTDSGG